MLLLSAMRCTARSSCSSSTRSPVSAASCSCALVEDQALEHLALEQRALGQGDALAPQLALGEGDALGELARGDDLLVDHRDDAVDERGALRGRGRRGAGEHEREEARGQRGAHQYTCSNGRRGRRLGGTSAWSLGLVTE